MSNVVVLYQGNDMVVELSGLRNEINGEFINNAIVAFTLMTTLGVPVSGQSFPAAMAYVLNSNGLYRATLADTVAILPGTRYKVEITADAGNGLNAKWDVDVVCQIRK